MKNEMERKSNTDSMKQTIIELLAAAGERETRLILAFVLHIVKK